MTVTPVTCRVVCRHCRTSFVTRPRGLCWCCYYTPGVKDLYPSTSKYARRVVGNFNGRGRTPEPTSAAPGTPDKISVLSERAAAGEALWHPLDATHEGRAHDRT